jgi:glycerol-3-phosphate acyltransferase PlsX
MGGDHAPAHIVDGALAAARHFELQLLLVGRRDAIAREVARHRDAGGLDVEIVDAPDTIGMAEPPAAALRRKPGASIRVAVDAVAQGRAGALFSAGSTGATLMAACSGLGLLAGVDRPALATAIPTRRRPAVLLDAGANVECRPQHLLQFAAMGTVYAQVALGIARPRVGLLSIGEEETKGNELIRETHRLLKGLPHFIGNVEGRDVYSGEADVIVCDGFTGNVALKVSEGLVDVIKHMLKESLESTMTRKIGYVLTKAGFADFRKRVDYSEYGGAPLLGVKGVCIICHGRSNANAVKNAIRVASEYAGGQVNRRIEAELGRWAGVATAD